MAVADFGKERGVGGPRSFEYPNYSIVLDPGLPNPTFAIAAPAATLTVTHNIVAGVGEFAFTGDPVILLKTGVYLLASSPGDFALSGTDAGLVFTRKIAAATGTFNLTGTDAGFMTTLVLTATSRSYAMTGTAATLKVSRKIAASPASFAMTGIALAINRRYNIECLPGSFLTGSPGATLNYSAWTEWVVQPRATATWQAA